MPEEFRIWKEKMDALELKKVAQAVARAEQAEMAALVAKEAPCASSSSGGAGQQGTNGGRAETSTPAVMYASPAEAAEAFKNLLADMNVTTIAKMKEVQDLCQHDVRWEALKTQGEKKQALAEYQVTCCFLIATICWQVTCCFPRSCFKPAHRRNG